MKVKIEKEKVYRIDLMLTQRELDVLATILAKIGGPSEGPRGLSEAVYDELTKAGAKPRHAGTGGVYLNSWGEFDEARELNA